MIKEFTFFKLKVLMLSIAINLTFFMMVAAQKETVSSELNGRITTDYGVPIPNVEILLESEYEFYKFRTDENGRYKINISPGVYRVNIGQWSGKLDYPLKERKYRNDCHSYFRPSQRAGFQLNKGQAAEINFILPEAECSNNGDRKEDSVDYGVFSVPEVDPRKPTDAEFGTVRSRFETLFYPRREFQNIPDLMIQFGVRTETDDKIIYKPVFGFRHFEFEMPDFDFEQPFPGVIVTYDLYTIYMNEAKFDKRRKELYGKGKIVVEDGTKRFKVKEVMIKRVQ